MWGRSCTVRDWHDQYVVTLELAEPPGYEPFELREAGSARAFLIRVCGEDGSALASLRRLASARWGGHALVRWSRTDLLEQLARELAGGSLKAFRKARPLLGGRGGRDEKGDPAPPTAFPVEITHRLLVKVVDDESGEPVGGCRFEARLADGARRPVTTRPDGIGEASGVPEGSFELTSPFGGITLATTLAIAEGGGGRKGGGKDEPPKPRQAESSYTIAKVKEHRVKKGDTLSTIAGDAGLSPVQLAYFNFGVYEPEAIEAALRDEVGCLHRNKDGKYVFDDSDEPGIVYVPSPWSKQGLPVDVENEVRVRRVERVLPDLKFWLQIDVHAEKAKDDKVILETVDGSWKHELEVKSLSEPEPGYVEAVFPSAPAGKRFNLVQDDNEGGEQHFVFEGLSYGDIREALAGQIEDEERFRDEEGAAG